MHVSFPVGDTQVLASDGMCQGQTAFQGFALSLSVADEAESERRFAALANGRQVRMPLAKTFLFAAF